MGSPAFIDKIISLAYNVNQTVHLWAFFVTKNTILKRGGEKKENKMTLSKLNFKRAASAIFGLVITLIFASLIVGSIYARVDTTFQYGGGWVSAVDLTAKTVTVSYPQPASACSESFCPKGKAPDVLKQGEVLVTNAKDWVENDITKMKVGDGVIVYFQVNNSKTTPYAVKDFNLYEECGGTITSPCGGYGTITPGR